MGSQCLEPELPGGVQVPAYTGQVSSGLGEGWAILGAVWSEGGKGQEPVLHVLEAGTPLWLQGPVWFDGKVDNGPSTSGLRD